MADEMRHKGVGGNLSQAEWEAIDSHILNSQATDDMVYASSATQLSRLAVAASRIIGKKATGGLAAMTVAELLTLIGVEAGATADLTGDEIVTLLEALAGAAQLSHTKISDIGATDHHAAAILQNLLTTKGDVIARTSSVPVRIGIGADDTVLTAASAEASGVKWAAVAGGATIVRKTADEIVNNNGTPQNDDHLFFAMGANEVWEVFVLLLTISPSSTPDMLVKYSLPAGATALGFILKLDTALTPVLETSIGDTVGVGVHTAMRNFYQMRMIVTNGANAGNCQLQWAQNTPTAEDTKVLTNSYLLIRKLN